MICLTVQDAFKKYLSEQSIDGIDPLNVFAAYDKGRAEGDASGEVPDKHAFIEPHVQKLYPCIVIDCPSATPTIGQDPLFRAGTYQANIIISLHAKVDDTSSDTFRSMCNSLSSFIYYQQNLLARKIVTSGLSIADSVNYGQQTFETSQEDSTWVCTINLQMVVG